MPTITSLRKKVVATIQGRLKELGFTTFIKGMAWRYRPGRIETVSIEFFTPTQARDLKCTPASFGIEQGIFFEALPYKLRFKFEDWTPEVYGSYMRLFLRKVTRSKYFQIPNIWTVDVSGADLETTVTDALLSIEHQGEPWFVSLRDDNEVIRCLMYDHQEWDEHGPFKKYGNLNAPSRNYVIAYMALKLGKLQMAADAFDRCLTDCPANIWPAFPDRDYAEVRKKLKEMAS